MALVFRDSCLLGESEGVTTSMALLLGGKEGRWCEGAQRLGVCCSLMLFISLSVMVHRIQMRGDGKTALQRKWVQIGKGGSGRMPESLQWAGLGKPAQRRKFPVRQRSALLSGFPAMELFPMRCGPL